MSEKTTGESHQKKIQSLLKEALVMLTKSGSKKEAALAVIISTGLLSMWRGDMTLDIAQELKKYKDILTDKADQQQEEEKIKDIIESIFEKHKKKGSSPKEVMNELSKKLEEEGIDAEIVQTKMDGTTDKSGTKELHNQLSKIAIDMVQSKDEVDNQTARIITKILLCRKFGIQHIIDNDCSKSDDIYDFLAKTLLSKEKSKKEKEDQAEKFLTDPKVDQSIKDLINDSLKNNPGN